MVSYKVRLFATVTSVAFGTGYQIYSTSVVNNVEDILGDWLNETYHDRNDRYLRRSELNIFWAAIVACVMVGACFGAASVFMISERLGRRKGLLLCGCISIAGGLLTAISKGVKSYELLVIGRLLLGYSLGAQLGISSLFLTEIAPLRYRGASGAVIGVFFGLGDFSSIAFTLPMILGTVTLWPVAFVMPAFPSLVQIATLLFSPESPRYLYLTKGNVQAAIKSLEYYQGPHNLEVTLAELEKEKNATTYWNKITMRQFLRDKRYRKQLLITINLNICSCFSGISALMAYSTSMMENAGLSLDDAKFASVGVGACNFILPFVTVFTVEKMGRRPVSLTGLTGCLVSVSLAAIFTGVTTLGHIESKAVSYLAVASLIMYIVVTIMYIIQQPVVVFLTSEIFEQDVRGMAMTVANIAFFSSAAIQVLAYPPFSEAVGVTYSFIPFIAITTVCLVYLYFKLPETKGKTIEETAARIRGTHVSLKVLPTADQIEIEKF